MLSEYSSRYLSATLTEKKEEERNSRSRRACDDIASEKVVRAGDLKDNSSCDLTDTSQTCSPSPLTTKMLIFASLCALLFAPLSLALGAQEDLDRLAVKGNGVIHLDAATFEILTSPKRTWSASVHFTALQPQRRCHPCKLVFSISKRPVLSNYA
jgi:hypothetical protein